MSEQPEKESDAAEEKDAGDSQNEFARHNDPTAKLPSLKKSGLLKQDAQRARERASDEEE